MLRTRTALRTATIRRSLPSGFSRKSKAPSRVASTAVVIVPWPEIMITIWSGRWVRRARRASMPFMPGSLTSRTTTSAGSASIAARPASAVSAVRTVNPSERSTIWKVRRMFFSSSTIRTEGFISPPRGRPQSASFRSDPAAAGAVSRW